MINSSVGTRGSSSSEIPVYFRLPTLFLTEQEDKMDSQNGTIYIATNLVNGKQGIGQTVRKLKERIYEHKKGRGSLLLHRAIRKYGIENFKWISFSCSEDDMDWMETFLIKELKTQVPNGYNLENGGNKNKHHHELSKQKMKENHPDTSGENNPFFGKHHSEETNQNNKLHHLGKCATLKTKNKMSESQIGIKNHFFGKYHKERTINIMKEKRKLRCKKIYLVNENDNIIKIYDTMIMAAKDNKISPDSVGKICHGIHNKSRNGLIFKFKENIKEN
jgi:group I intron endonuclease